MLLTFLEDIAQNYPSDCFFYIPEIRTIAISTILKAMALEQDTSSCSENMYFSRRKRG